MNPKSTLVVAFSRNMPEYARAKVMDDVLRIERVDAVRQEGAGIVLLNDTRSGTQVRKDILNLKLSGVVGVYEPPLSKFFANDLPQP